MSGTWIFLPPTGGGVYFGDPVANVGSLPATGTQGEIRYVIASNAIYAWDGAAWIATTVAPGSIDINTDTTGTLAVSRGGTNSTTALNNNRVMQSSGGKIQEAAAITASRALASDTNGIPVASATTAAELAFVNGVTSAIQTQLNNKQASGNYITALTGDVTASGPGSVAATLATVNGNVGSFGTATQVGSFTVNGKGLITAAANTSIQLASSAAVTGLDAQLAAKAPLASPTFTGTVTLNGGALQLATLTTTQRDALTPAAGMMIFNTTVNRFQGYFSGSWGNLHGWGDPAA